MIEHKYQSDRIRTYDLSLPKRALSQTELHSENVLGTMGFKPTFRFRNQKQLVLHCFKIQPPPQTNLTSLLLVQLTTVWCFPYRHFLKNATHLMDSTGLEPVT